MARREIVVVGLGIPEGKAMSLQARAELAACDVVYAYHPNAELSQAAREVRSLPEFGTRWSADVMDRAAAAILGAARSGRVGVAVYGDPTIYEPLARAVLAACRAAKVRCRVVPAVSAIVAVLAAAGASVATGEPLHVGDEELYARRAPDPEAWTLVYKALQSRDLQQRIVARCLESFPPSHRVALVEVPGYDAGFTRWTTLGALAARPAPERPYATLLIPPRARAAA